MKDVLKWIPIVWVVGWAMNMPFLKRYSKEKLRRNPELRGKDVASMKKSFEDLSIYPGTVFSFAEGTRFSEAKQKEENSNFYKLLAPKAGGIAITIATMPYIRTIIDFTIVLLWFYYGFPGFYYGFTMVLLWFYCGFLDFTMVFLVFTMVLRGFIWFRHCHLIELAENFKFVYVSSNTAFRKPSYDHLKF